MSKNTHGKPFQKGHDPRRHVFTPEECRRGFQAALESLIRRYPPQKTGGRDMVHFYLCAMIGSKSGYYIQQAFRETCWAEETER